MDRILLINALYVFSWDSQRPNHSWLTDLHRYRYTKTPEHILPNKPTPTYRSCKLKLSATLHGHLGWPLPINILIIYKKINIVYVKHSKISNKTLGSEGSGDTILPQKKKLPEKQHIFVTK